MEQAETLDIPLPTRAIKPSFCESCGKPIAKQRIGRPRRYCNTTCKQRAYEERKEVERAGLPEGAVVLTAAQVAAYGDRIFQVQCAVEDIVSATEDGSTVDEIGQLAHQLLSQVRGMDLR